MAVAAFPVCTVDQIRSAIRARLARALTQAYRRCCVIRNCRRAVVCGTALLDHLGQAGR